MKILKNKAAAWCAMALIVILTVVSFCIRMKWWMLFDVFFAFLAVFCHLMSIYLDRMSHHAALTLEKCALACIILSFVAFGVQFCITP